MVYRGFSAFVLCLAGLSPAAAAQEAVLQPGGGVSIANPDRSATLAMSGRMQLRHVYEDHEHDPDVNNFGVARLLLSLKGSVHAWRWEVQSDFAKWEAVTLTDAFVEHAVTRGMGLRLGQFKVAYDRQRLESSGRQAFVDRNIATRAFGMGRDVGVQLRGAAPGRVLQYNLGVFNGAGQGQANTGSGNLFAGRVSWNPLGDFGLSQGDIKPAASPRVFVDAACYFNRDGFVAVDGYGDEYGWASGAGLRFAGAYAAGEYFHRNRAVAGSVPATVSAGWYAQAGYMLIPDLFEAVARYARVDPDTDSGDDLRGETTGGVNVFLDGRGHGLKLTVDAAWLTDEAPGAEDHLRTRAQIQFTF